MISYQEDLINFADAAQRDPSLLPNHFSHDVPDELRKIQAELVMIADLLNKQPEPSTFRDEVLADLERVNLAVKFYEDAEAQHLEAFRLVTLTIKFRRVEFRLLGYKPDGLPRYVYAKEQRGTWRPCKDPETLRVLHAHLKGHDAQDGAA